MVYLSMVLGTNSILVGWWHRWFLDYGMLCKYRVVGLGLKVRVKC